jgi:hypothetical protein
MPPMRRTSLLGLAPIIALAACGDNRHVATDGAPIDNVEFDAPIDGNSLTPQTLAETGLCTNPACTTFAADVHAYAPQYALWADGATKRRWIYLPPGSQIDTTDMNFWIFPVGTKLWKEFTRDGVRVETRYIVKLLADDTMPGAWFFVSYQWNATQDATMAVTQGVMNANGTDHDIPSRSNCRRCHENTPGRVLGFQAMSLDYAAPAGNLDLDDAIAMGLLSSAPPGAASPHYPLPGTAVDQTAFGYLHANCGGCHNTRSTIHDTTPLELRLDVSKLAAVTDVPARVTTVNVNGTVQAGGGSELLGKIVAPGDPTNSVIILRTTATTSPPRMPEIGTELVDPAGQAALTAWISQPP